MLVKLRRVGSLKSSLCECLFRPLKYTPTLRWLACYFFLNVLDYVFPYWHYPSYFFGFYDNYLSWNSPPPLFPSLEMFLWKFLVSCHLYMMILRQTDFWCIILGSMNMVDFCHSVTLSWKMAFNTWSRCSWKPFLLLPLLPLDTLSVLG